MNYYFCDACRYCFSAEELPDRCPDCGAQIYKEFLDRKLVSRIYLTVINNIYDADTFIPNLYGYGFRYEPTHPLNVETGYEKETLSENGKDKFSIRTLIKN